MIEKIRRTFGFILNHPLASKNKALALSKFLFWQCQTLLFPKRYFRKNFADQLVTLVNKGQTGMTGNIYTGLHEFDDMMFLLHFLRPGDIFVDAGANVGSYTLLASGLTKAKSISFEPIPSTFQNLKNNIDINNLRDLVQLHNMGLSSKKSILKFSSLDDTTNHVLTSATDTGIDIEVTSVDEILAGKKPSLIKIDVEGYETEVLKGAQKALQCSSLKAVIIELNGSGNRYGYSDEVIHSELLKYGFKPSEYAPFERKLDFKETYGKTNTIYIRDTEYVASRLSSSPTYRILNCAI